MMGRCHLRCKNRTLLLCSVSLLRVGDKFRVFLLNSLYFIYFMLLLVLFYCPKLGQKFFTKWCYSPDINSFRFQCGTIKASSQVHCDTVKAFLPTDWEFYDDTGAIISIHPLNSEPQDFPKKLRVTFRIQKNRQNGQKLTLVTDDGHPDICPVRAAYRIFLRAKRLGQSDLQPMGLRQGSTPHSPTARGASPLAASQGRPGQGARGA